MGLGGKTTGLQSGGRRSGTVATIQTVMNEMDDDVIWLSSTASKSGEDNGSEASSVFIDGPAFV